MKKKIKKVKFGLKKLPEVLAVYLFGLSVARLDHRFSDLDVGVVVVKPEDIFNSPKETLRLYERFFDVLSPLVENSDKLDLVFLQKTPFSLQKKVVLSGKLVYCKDIQQLLDYKEKVILKYADIKPVYKQFYKEVYNTRL